MKKKVNVTKRILAAFLAACILVMSVPFAALSEEVPLNYTSVTDPATVNDWKLFFGSEAETIDTTSAGMVWTDKSVFSSVADLTAATDENENDQALADLAELEEESFLVALSAIASSKSVEGYSTLPTDTVLVLDLSASMETNQAVSATVQAANAALDKLLNLNANNRVGVIAYSGSNSTGTASTVGTAEVILPLGRYTPGVNNTYLVSSWRSGSDWRTGVKVNSGVTGTVADDIESTFSESNSKRAEGGTYIQNGLYQAWEQFEAVAETTLTEGIQAGVERVPVMVLLSDGAPTTATTSYTEVDTANSGNGSSTYATPGIAFMTQLTASWVRDKMEEKYGTDPLFYTLGLKVDDSDAAQSVLDPSSNTATDAMWNEYIALADETDKTMSVTIRDGYWTQGGGPNYGGPGGGPDDDEPEWVDPETKTITYTDAVLSDGWAENYVTEYFPASNAAGLIQAFEDIVQQIVIQSLYYPTQVETGNSINEDGFLEFEDYIGENMEVKDVKGIQLGEKLYTGRTLAKMIYEGGMGTVEKPTDVGNNLVWSVQARLGIDSVQEARELLGLAYANGQLYYNPETGEYNNYIGWYADGNGKYIGFWDGKDDSPAAVPAALADTAVYAIKSYGYYDAIGDDDTHRKTDMMYATIQVRTTLKETAAGKIDASKVGDTRVIGRLPASLIPLVEYDIDLKELDPMDPATLTITGATAPSRLIYEVGLDDAIDLLDIENTAPDALQTENGKYVFYTNQWQYNQAENAYYDYQYSTDKNTISFFEPSLENERYYYTADTPIYTDTAGTLYTGATTPVYDENNPLYHRFLVYSGSGSNVTATWHYEQVSEHVMEHAGDMERLADGSWIVTRGTIYHYYGDYVMEKTENRTNTLPDSDRPFVHDPSAGVNVTKGVYHVDSYLGNNGKLLVDPYEGIKITKTADSTIEDRTLDYTFEITASDAAFAETLVLIKEDAAGQRSVGALAFTAGKATLTLKSGEIAYVTGNAMIGKTFTVAEVIPSDADYEVYSVNGDTAAITATVAVTSGVINSADFVNTKPQDGDIVISKTVVSDHNSHLTKEFEFTVTHTGTENITATRSDGQIYTLLAGQNNTVTLTHGQVLHIADLPAGVTVTATEADYTAVGFTANAQTGYATAAIGETRYIRFTNTYDAKDTVPPTNVKIQGIKNLVGTAADSTARTFEFKLQKLHKTTNTYVDLGVANAAVTYTNELGQKTFAFDVSALQNEIFTEAGAYSYRVVEIVNDSYVANGYVYDATPAYFDVIVSDNEQGQLYISNVAAGTDATVATATVGDVTEWTVNASFENRYEVNGAAEAVINIKKTVTGNKGALIPPSGFEFTLYHADGQWTKGEEAGNAPATSTAGTTDIALLFNDATQVGTKYYVLEEKVPASADSRIDYSEEAYGIKVDVGTESGNYTITVTVYKLENGTATFINTYTGSAGTVTVAEIPDGVITFENTFTPEAAVAPAITATKNLTGKKLTADLFEFELYEITPQGEVWKETVGNKAPANADDPTAAVEFTALTFEQAGTYQYVVREKLPAGIDANNKHLGTTYDTRKYTVTVTVTGDNTTGTLTASWVSALDGYVTDIVFDNLYTVDPVTDVVIGGTKHLTGGIRKLQANAFYFELLQNDQVIGNVGNGVPTDDANAAFAFEPLTFYTVGTYYYTVREHRPDGVDASNPTRFGVTYDLNEYDVTVVVTDQGDGTLHAQVQYPEGTPAFENSYHVSPTSVDLTGTKTLIGDAIAKYTGEKAFVYELYAAEYDLDTKTVEQGAKITEAREDGTGTFAFNASAIAQLNFSAIGAYRFVIREQIPADADPLMNYDESVYFIEVDVSDDLQGGLKTDMKVTKVDEHGASSTVGSDEINFINELMEEPVAVELGGTKSYNKTLTDGQFTFELYQAMERNGEIVAVGEPLLEATNAADGSFKFEEMLLTDELSGLQVMTTYMTFSKAGTYHFVIKEKLPEGVSATNKHKDGITYDTNSYVVTVEVTEVTDHTGRDVLVYEVTADGVKNGSITVTNIYDPADAKVTLSGTKTLTGRDMTDGEFTFELYSVAKDGAETLKEFKTNASGTFTFSELIFDQADTYRYKIVEKKGDAVKVAYDETVYEVEIVVTDVNGVLIPETTINGEETTTVGFKNVYDPDDAKVTLSGNKLLTGRALKDGEFTFELYSVKDGAETLKEAVTNKGSAFTFSEMIFDKAENYQYKIIEKKGDAAKVTYDETVYQVQIVVTDINGVLTPSVTVNGSAETKIIFKNAYDPDDAKLAISGTKNLTGRDLVDGEFTFELYSVDQNGTETLLESKTNVGNTFVFSERVYDQVGEYHYRVKEMAGTDSTITYDTKTYDLVVKVTDANGVLNAAVVVDGSKDATVVFNNLYTPPIVPEPTPEPTPEPVPEPVPTPTPNEDEPTSPYTGGGSNPGLLIALFVITGGLLFLFFKKRKVENR